MLRHGRRSALIGSLVGVLLGTAAYNLVSTVYGTEAALKALGWFMLIFLPVAGLDAWAGSMVMDRRIGGWIRLVVFMGVGLVAGLYLIFRY